MLCLFVVASSAAAAPLTLMDSPTVPANSSNASNTTAEINATAETNTTTEAPIAEVTDGRQRPWWERLSERHRELHKGQSWCGVVADPVVVAEPVGHKHSLPPLTLQVAAAPRDARGFKSGSARAFHDLGSTAA